MRGWNLLGVLVCMLVGGAILLADPPASTQPAPIDWNRARVLHQRMQRGETLSPEDQAYLQRAMAERQKNANTTPASKPVESTGLIPLDQLGKEKYKDMDGGLYGDGSNRPPDALQKAADAAIAKIKPLDADGKPADDGKIVLMSIGMSNTTMEFSRFKKLADDDKRKLPRVVIVDAAQGGQDAAAWVGKRGNAKPWDVAMDRLKQSGVTPPQVQAIWIKQALANPAQYGTEADALKTLQDDLEQIIKTAHERFPNLRVVYLSSRIYAGYALGGLNPEPYAYEGAFAVRNVIQAHAKGDITEPVILWGPYLWSDGTKGRKSDTLVYKREDLGGDGTHPSASGQQKVAELLVRFFCEDEGAKGWFAEAADNKN